MILALDIGNSQIFGGVFDANQELLFHFRRSTSRTDSSDQYGLFLKTVLRENGIDPKDILKIGLCSVVPETLHSLVNCCRKYFSLSPFVLKVGVKTGLKIKYNNPSEVGADRIADAIAGSTLYPGQDLIIIDFGTATTVEVVTKNKEYLGGAILPGLKISMQALERNTSRLPSVEIIKPTAVVGRTTTESIQSGLFYGVLGGLKELVHKISENHFLGDRPYILGTGGFASLFEYEDLFDEERPNLVLEGLVFAMKMNEEKRRESQNEN